MRNITLFYDGSFYTFKWLKALLWTEEQFWEHGFKIGFLNDEEKEHTHDKVNLIKKDIDSNEFDIVFLAFHESHVGLCSLSDEDFDVVMSKLRKKSNIVVWLDTADSTGDIYYKAFKYVDVYLKKQILKDRSQYRRQILADRSFVEYELQNNLITLSAPIKTSIALSDEEIDKMHISWNIGLADLFEERDKSYMNGGVLTTPNVDFYSKKVYDVHFRGSLGYDSCSRQRNEVIRQLKEQSGLKVPDVTSKVSFEEYINEIRESKIVISPYGWGEICFRDFESFLCGSVLLKPNMSHIDTYPNWYQEGKTYYALDWKMDKIVDECIGVLHDKNYDNVRRSGYELFMKYRCGSDDVKNEFVERILRAII